MLLIESFNKEYLWEHTKRGKTISYGLYVGQSKVMVAFLLRKSSIIRDAHYSKRNNQPHRTKSVVCVRPSASTDRCSQIQYSILETWCDEYTCGREQPTWWNNRSAGGLQTPRGDGCSVRRRLRNQAGYSHTRTFLVWSPATFCLYRYIRYSEESQDHVCPSE